MTEITKPLPGATIDYGHPTNRGLLGRWLFNEGAGSRIADISGNGNHGKATNIDLTSAWRGSPQGRSLEFDGVDAAVIIPRSHSLRPLTSLSIVAWVNGPGVGGLEYLITHYVTTGGQRSWAIHTSDNGANFNVKLSTDGTLAAGQFKNYVSQSPFSPFDGTWHQIGFAFDGPSSILNLYVDGHSANQIASTDNPITSLHDSTGDVYFGALGNPGNFWDGKISDVGMYDRALQAAEFVDLFAAPYSGLLD